MSSIKIYKDDSASNTVISNKFIDEYMVDANDAQIKVYLYLLRMMSANLPTGISDMADKFNHTEKDIVRALKYWEKCHLLSLEFDEMKNLTGIRFLSPAKDTVPEARPLAPIVPLKLVTNDTPVKEVDVAPAKVQKSYSYNEIPSYSLDDKMKFKSNPETMNIPFLAETYLGKNISSRNLDTLYFIHHELGFSEDLIDHLLQYCVDHNSTSFSYISKVACDWAENGINTVEKAKSYVKNVYDKNVYIIMKDLGRNDTPTAAEAEFVSKWYKEYGYDMDVIGEACKRTVISTPKDRLKYCNSILTDWHNSGIHTLKDVAANDTSYKKTKTSNPASSKNSFNNFSMTQDYDFDEIEKMILSK